MEIIPLKDSFKIENIDKLTVDNIVREEGKHGSLLPNSVRCIVSGPSNCGKTNVVFNLITNPNGLKFNNVYIFSKSLLQPKYQLLEKIISEVPEVNLFKFDASNSIMPPSQAKPFSVFIFDDVSCENHDTIRNYFAMGRHYNIDSIYIGQTYSKIPKQLIRDNANMIIIFKQDDMNLKHIHNDHVGGDMTFDKLKLACYTAWKDRYGFLVIVKEKDVKNGRYRIGFDRIVIIQ
jgi:hypothetical protein